MLNFAVLSSSRASSLQAIYSKIKCMDGIQWQLAVSNKATAGLLNYAKDNNVAAVQLSHLNKSAVDYGNDLTKLMHQHEIDFILLVGFMRILSTDFVREWAGKVVNIHPSLLPKHQGLMDKAVHQAVLDNGEKETGCSLHLVTADVDRGPVVMQRKCSVEINDTVETLKQKVQALEAQCLLSYIKQKAHYEQTCIST